MFRLRQLCKKNEKLIIYIYLRVHDFICLLIHIMLRNLPRNYVIRHELKFLHNIRYS